MERKYLAIKFKKKFASHISPKELIPKLYKEFLNRNRVTDVENKLTITRGK